MEHWTAEEYKNFTNKNIKKTKYRANKTSVDGHTFDSQKEANYYNMLKLRLQAKDIKGFCLQPTFILAPGLKYKADFITFNNDGTYFHSTKLKYAFTSFIHFCCNLYLRRRFFKAYFNWCRMFYSITAFKRFKRLSVFKNYDLA